MRQIAKYTGCSVWAGLGLVAAFAVQAQPVHELTRAEVVRATLDARANGSLTPAGEADYPPPARTDDHSTMTRAEVLSQARAALSDKQYSGGEAGEEFVITAATVPSLNTRAEVKAETLAAARAGELVPAGEGAQDSPGIHTPPLTFRQARSNSVSKQVQ